MDNKVFYITGGGFENKGAESMLITLISELRSVYPSSKIYVEKLEYGKADNNLNCEFVPAVNESYAYALGRDCSKAKMRVFKRNVKGLIKFILKMQNYFDWHKISAVKKIIDKVDAIFDISGYVLSSKWSDNDNDMYLSRIELAKSKNIPIYLLPQSFGPFDYSNEKIISRIESALKYPKYVFAREQEGYLLLKDKFNIENLRLSCDVVLAGNSIQDNLVYKQGYEPNKIEISTKNNVVLVPNSRNVENNTQNDLVEIYIKIITKLLQMGKTVYLFYHSREDLVICEKIYSNFSKNEKVILYKKELGCREYSSFISNFDFAIASRFHSIVHAYKECVPCIVMGWAIKYHELTSAFNQHKYMFDVRDKIDADKLLETLDLINSNNSTEKEEIKNRLNSIKQNGCFTEIREVI